ncbi:MAG: class II aldolase/adducin family protein [Firmicutes bacterium]|nr:class II aldolase/adducin family protein [Bacillota bacterium]
MEQKLREALVAYGVRLVKEGLVQGTWGNISVRLDDTYMLVTPSGLDYLRLTPADMVKVKIDTLEYEGALKPTSEKGLHAALYQKRPDLGAVIHTHSKYCCMFAAARKPLSVEDPGLQEVFGAEVPLAGYGLPGSKRLMKNTVDTFGNGMGAIMTAHGMICGGADIEDAFENCRKMEGCAEDYIESRWAELE